MIYEYYKYLGFNVVRNKFFTSPHGDKVEIDVLASKPQIHLTIAVECKNYEEKVIGASILLKVTKIKSVIPRAIVHIYAKHISNHIISNRAFWNDPRYRDVFFFSTKQIHAIHDMFEKGILKAS